MTFTAGTAAEASSTDGDHWPPDTEAGDTVGCLDKRYFSQQVGGLVCRGVDTLH